MIVADLSNDATYGEALFEMFGRRVIGVQIGRLGDGTTFERRRVKNGAMPVYNVGRTFLLELLLAKLRDHHIRVLVDSPESRRAYEQLAALEPEQRDSGIVYKCPAGQHDDLGMSLAMLAWAAQHLHLNAWQQPIFDAHRRRRQQQKFGWSSFVYTRNKLRVTLDSTARRLSWLARHLARPIFAPTFASLTGRQAPRIAPQRFWRAVSRADRRW